jgi:hypothetical protein
VLQHHVFEIVDPRQVERSISLAEHSVISPQPLNLRGFQHDAAPL